MLKLLQQSLVGGMVESVESQAEQAGFKFNHGTVVYFPGIPLRHILQILFCKQLHFQQLFRTDDQRLSGKGGKTLIGGITETGGSQGKNLP